MSRRILVVEDDDAIIFGLRTNLSFEGYQVESVNTCAGAVERALEFQPDLIVLDLMLPDGSGFEVMEGLAKAGFDGRILVLSARIAETDKVSALKMGADDYVTKPFSLAELIARIGALLRRVPPRAEIAPPAVTGAHSAPGHSAAAHGAAAHSAAADTTAERKPEVIRFGRCEVDEAARTLRVDGQPVVLTRLEFDLLVYLAHNAGRALTRAQLLRDVWNLSHDGPARTVDNLVAHLRTKIGEDAERPRHLITLRGSGYRFVLEPEDGNASK